MIIKYQIVCNYDHINTILCLICSNLHPNNMSRNKLSIISILGWASFILFCLLLGYAIGSTDLLDSLLPNEPVSEPISVLKLIISITLGILSVLVIHELGHLFTGLAHGFQFAIYIVGPFGWKKEVNGKTTFYFNKSSHVRWCCGNYSNRKHLRYR